MFVAPDRGNFDSSIYHAEVYVLINVNQPERPVNARYSDRPVTGKVESLQGSKLDSTSGDTRSIVGAF